MQIRFLRLFSLLTLLVPVQMPGVLQDKWEVSTEALSVLALLDLGVLRNLSISAGWTGEGELES
jgi:hypothetical protein